MTLRPAFRSCLFLLCFLLACAEPTPEQPAPAPVLGPIDPPRAPAEPAPSEDPQTVQNRRFGTVSLHAGFNPDPHVVHGTAEGEVRASSIRRKCKGFVSKKPDYLLRSETAFFRLYVLARSEQDVSLVVRDPNGKVICNDDRKGTRNPRVQANIPIGTTELWVGVKAKGAKAPYSLGFSEVNWKPNSLPLPPP